MAARVAEDLAAQPAVVPQPRKRLEREEAVPAAGRVAVWQPQWGRQVQDLAVAARAAAARAPGRRGRAGHGVVVEVLRELGRIVLGREAGVRERLRAVGFRVLGF